jgi:hypothetical protein
MLSLATGLFALVLLLNQRRSPLLRLQVSDCSTFRIMCDVSSTAVFCSESIECFPGMTSKFFLQTFVTIAVAPIITGAQGRTKVMPPICFHINYKYCYNEICICQR